MTPKEKAEDLFVQYRMRQTGIQDESISIHQTKKCVEILLNEMINVVKVYNHRIFLYWKEVKSEFDKL